MDCVHRASQWARVRHLCRAFFAEPSAGAVRMGGNPAIAGSKSVRGMVAGRQPALLQFGTRRIHMPVGIAAGCVDQTATRQAVRCPAFSHAIPTHDGAVASVPRRRGAGQNRRQPGGTLRRDLDVELKGLVFAPRRSALVRAALPLLATHGGMKDSAATAVQLAGLSDYCILSLLCIKLGRSKNNRAGDR
jgi:hypothetical protein